MESVWKVLEKFLEVSVKVFGKVFGKCLGMCLESVWESVWECVWESVWGSVWKVFGKVFRKCLESVWTAGRAFYCQFVIGGAFRCQLQTPRLSACCVSGSLGSGFGLDSGMGGDMACSLFRMLLKPS